jgi:hypothetical protein
VTNLPSLICGWGEWFSQEDINKMYNLVPGRFNNVTNLSLGFVFTLQVETLNALFQG